MQADINDDHIVKIHDVLSDSNRLIMIMEYCEGGNLFDWIKRNRRHDILNEKVFKMCFHVTHSYSLSSSTLLLCFIIIIIIHIMILASIL